jgi:hypothetical protein
MRRSAWQQTWRQQQQEITALGEVRGIDNAGTAWGLWVFAMMLAQGVVARQYSLN